MITLFEQYQQYRDVNMSQFFHDYEKYRNDNDSSVMFHVRSMLMNNRVSFQDSVMREGTSGTVNEVNYNITAHNEYLSIYFDEDKNTHTLSLKDNFDKGGRYRKYISTSSTIRIFSEKTEIEKEIDLIKGAEKYNL